MGELSGFVDRPPIFFWIASSPTAAGGVERLVMSASVMLLKIGWPLRVRGLGGVLGPDAGVAVGLQLQPHRERVGVVRVALLLAAHLGLGAEQVLHVVAVLVGQHVRLGELARRRRTGWQQLVVERQVDVDQVVLRAVERTDAGVGLAAAGVDRLAEEDGLGGWYCSPKTCGRALVQYAWIELTYRVLRQSSCFSAVLAPEHFCCSEVLSPCCEPPPPSISVFRPKPPPTSATSTAMMMPTMPPRPPPIGIGSPSRRRRRTPADRPPGWCRSARSRSAPC